ncbi:hypothetical protein SAMN05661093_08065 [Kibdelosporangium aridum]|uniref:Uncharacterized protein n=1 Tax=Kibdelosporangium aridum TaxID=2030 RepID=A0A1W2FNH8_KIBAR|nr:hypothetical protein SAMN05661093_08065 [Kibdelosporangium aridum]
MTGPHVRIPARTAHPHDGNAGSSQSGSTTEGDRPASPTSASPRPPCTGYWPATSSPGCGMSTGPPANQSAATNIPHQAISSTSTSQSWATSPDGGGHTVHGRTAGHRNSSAHRDPAHPRKGRRRANLGHSYLHNAVDDHSRHAYTEILTDEPQQTAAAYWQRTQLFFHANRITVHHVSSPTTDPATAHTSGATPSPRRYHPQTHAPSPSPDQRQSRTRQPHPARRIGLHPPRPDRNRTTSSAPAMPVHRQSPRPHRTRRQTTRQPRSQPNNSRTPRGGLRKPIPNTTTAGLLRDRLHGPSGGSLNVCSAVTWRRLGPRALS